MLAEGAILNHRYRVGKLLGTGSTGSVFEAEHLGVGRRVAIKLLHSELASVPMVAQRFHREARAAAAIGNEHIVDVFDSGSWKDLPFLVMEKLAGESLCERLKKTKALPIGRAVYILSQILEGLHAAHQAQIVHRDLKPDNVFLTKKLDTPDFVKILDFGVSKFRGGAISRNDGTQPGAIIGTPNYMSPEQATAQSDVDHRSDIYSAGVVLYEMITGAVPFSGENPIALLVQIAYRKQPIKPPRALVPSISPDLEAIILKAISLKPEDRFQDALAFATAIQPWIEVPIPTVDDDAFPSALRTGRFAAVKVAETPQLPAKQLDDPPTPEPTVVSPTKSQSPPSRANLRVFAGAIAGFAIVTGVVLLTRLLVPSGSTQAPNPTTVANSPNSVADARVVGSLNLTSIVDLEGLPERASLFLDGNEVRGPHLTLQRGRRYRLRVTAPNYLPYETSLSTEHEHTQLIVLASPLTVGQTQLPDASDASQNPQLRRENPPATAHTPTLLPMTNQF